MPALSKLVFSGSVKKSKLVQSLYLKTPALILINDLKEYVIKRELKQ